MLPQLSHALLWAAAVVPLGAASSSQSRVQDVANRYGADCSGRPSHSDRVYQTPFDGVTWDVQNWRLASTVLDQGHYQSRGSVANGYIGINLASVGPFFELDLPVNGDAINGWPLFSRRQTFAGLAGFWDQQSRTNGTNFEWLYQYGGESTVSGLPHWGALILDLGDGQYLDALVDSKTISNYSTAYDFKAGILSWHYTWTPSKGQTSFDISYQIFAHKLNVNQGVVRLTVVPSADGAASVVNLLEGYAAVRTSFVASGQDGDAIYSAVKPVNVETTAYVYAAVQADKNVVISKGKIVNGKPYILGNDSSIAQSSDIKFKKGKAFTITKYVGIASTDAFSNPRKTAKDALQAAKKSGYDDLLRSHISEWAQAMPDDSVDDFTSDSGALSSDPFILESSIMAVVNPYYLLQNTVSENALQKTANAPVNDYSIAVGGLSSDSYAGLIFWDADVWMQPGLVAAFPLAAQRITNYRAATYGQAKRNIQTASSSSKSGTWFAEDDAIYPWTSGRSGNCTGTGPCWDYEYHLNGDICMGLLNQWVASGDTKTFQDTHFPIYNSIASTFANLLTKNGSSWTLTNSTDPDEYANHVDAGGFTMPLIAQTLRNANLFRKQFGLEPNATWESMADNVLIIRENNVTLEYSTMTNDVEVKQADVVLDTYPLDYTTNYTSGDALNDLDYYALKQSPDGPGMTYAIFSIVANKVSPSGCSAYTYAQYSYKPYTRAPFYQFSEQLLDDYTVNGGTHPAFPFLTGHGGANQVVLFGYLGLRFQPDDILHIDPNLPPQIPHLTYRTFYWRGWPISAKSSYDRTTISRSKTVAPLATADQRFANVDITVQVGSADEGGKAYKLPANGRAITIPNRKIGTINTVKDNLVQCQPAQSWDAFQPGQFPISAVDGAASTKWQPELASSLSSITVTIPKSKGKLTGFYFDWAQSPPVNATIILHNKAVDSASASNALLSSGGASGNIQVNLQVNISDPWNPQTGGGIHLQGGNSTNYTFPAAVAATKFATLFVQGNQGSKAGDVQRGNATGATVAEWAILGSQ